MGEGSNSKPRANVAASLKKAIAATLKEMVAGGIDGKTLRSIERFCAAQAQALMAIEHPDVKTIGGKVGVGVGSVYYAGEDTSDEVGSALSPAPFPETFGTNVSRNLIAGITKMVEKLAPSTPRPSPIVAATDLIYAIAAARREGLNDIADQLAKQLAELTAVAQPTQPSDGTPLPTPAALAPMNGASAASPYGIESTGGAS